MHPTTLLFTTLLASTTTTTTATPFKRTLSNFYLVTTTQCASTTNSSLLANVSATSVYDPSSTTNYSIRLIDSGYESLPQFNLTNGDLVTLQYEPMNEGQAVYNSTGAIGEGQQLQLAPSVEPSGNLGLKDGYLLTVGGEEVGWTVCEAEEERVIYWKGNDSSCTSTYIHAVSSPPY